MWTLCTVYPPQRIEPPPAWASATVRMAVVHVAQLGLLASVNGPASPMAAA
jgi:hypothetical protein